MTYTVKQITAKREAFGHYTYHIFQAGQLVATYWHDYRGDEHGIIFMHGKKEAWPVGRMVDFLTGGGPQPLGLSAKAVAYLDEKLEQQ
ncbi:MAG: hypothetical protein MUD01_27160 [Chloroflexaceae bacterium]|jgi:hypothetical protein|nr:hypothetical protein [Chloroflexaceae bacterium]